MNNRQYPGLTEIKVWVMISSRKGDTNPSNQDKGVCVCVCVCVCVSLSNSRFLVIIQVCYSTLFRESRSFFHANFPHSQDYLIVQNNSWSFSHYVYFPISRKKEGKMMSWSFLLRTLFGICTHHFCLYHIDQNLIKQPDLSA